MALTDVAAMLRILLSLLFSASIAHADFYGRINVIDGDTFDVGSVRVRLHAVDAPEFDQTCKRSDGAEWACGQWVTDEVRKRVQGKRASCHAVTVDRYDRTVAKCEVQGRDLGQWLVSDGLIFSFPRYGQDYVATEKEALVAGRGLHASEVQSPSEYRAEKRAVSVQIAPQANCVIKGNISSKGTRIYHMPGQSDYASTQISERKGERWFCSEAEAQSAGWRRAAR